MKKKKAIFGVLNALFYIFLACAIAAAFFLSGAGTGRPHMIGGYTGMIVLSGSMQSEIPKGSLVVVKKANPADIKVGDDISFIRSDNETVTHRVIEVHENYEESGLRAFITKGTDNPLADEEPVFENNVIGQVVWHNSAIGQVVDFVRNNLIFVIICAALILALSVSLTIYFRPTGKKKKAENQSPT